MFNYQPKTMIETDAFVYENCNRCERDRTFRETGKHGCDILADTFVYDVHDDKYPKEWTFNNYFKPVCTAFVSTRCSKTVDMFDSMNHSK